MPVVSEKSEGSRRVARGWLAGCGVVLGLLLLLPLVPFVTPVTLHVGDRWLCVRTQLSQGPGQPFLTTGRMDLPALTVPSGGPGSRLIKAVDLHARGLRFGRWQYWVWSFRGQEVGGG